jgi:hypothetical protein
MKIPIIKNIISIIIPAPILFIKDKLTTCAIIANVNSTAPPIN